MYCKRLSFLVIDTILASDNPLLFRKNLCFEKESFGKNMKTNHENL